MEIPRELCCALTISFPHLRTMKLWLKRTGASVRRRPKICLPTLLHPSFFIIFFIYRVSYKPIAIFDSNTRLLKQYTVDDAASASSIYIYVSNATTIL